jgi:hypothetical protein
LSAIFLLASTSGKAKGQAAKADNDEKNNRATPEGRLHIIPPSLKK